MKNYAEIYANLREEIMQQIDSKVDDILSKYDVERLSDLEDEPTFDVLISQYIDDGAGGGGYSLIRIEITDIFVGGECEGYGSSMQLESYNLYEFETDSLISVYEKLCKYSS